MHGNGITGKRQQQKKARNFKSNKRKKDRFDFVRFKNENSNLLWSGRHSPEISN